MHAPPYHILFLCDDNAVRSILAEATMNALGYRRFMAYSAGSNPVGRISPFAIRQLRNCGIPSSGYRSKSLDEFFGWKDPSLDFLVMLSESAAVNDCENYFGNILTTRWVVPDPLLVEGPDRVKDMAFARAHEVIRHRIDQLVELPIQGIPSSVLRYKLDAIAQSLPQMS